MLGKIEGKRREGQQRLRWLDGTTDSMAINLSKLQEIVKDRQLQRVGHDLVTEQQQTADDPVARIPSSQRTGPGFNPWSGN